MLKALAWFTITLGISSAADQPDKAVLIGELSDSYSKLEGFIATYRSKGENKELRATVSFDQTSSQSTLEFVATTDGRPMEFRTWYTDNDVLYLDSGNGSRAQIQGIGEEFRFLASFGEIGNELGTPLKGLNFALTPNFMLTSDSLEATIKTTQRSAPGWLDSVDHGEIKEVTDDQVVFSTKDYGELTIGRKNGIMLRQTFDAQDDDRRVLELVELKTNPGRDAIASLSKDWSTLGASPIGVGTISSELRFKAFQMVITAIENGEADLGKLETKLNEDKDELIRFANSCLMESPGSLIHGETWKKMMLFMRENAKKVWLDKVPGADAADEEGFKAFLMEPGIRKSVRKGFVQMFVDDPDLREKFEPIVLKEMFPSAPDQSFVAQDESGKRAKELITSALLGAYIDVIFQRKMNAFWGDRDDLD